MAADCPLLHLQSFYRTRGHYPGHRILSECGLVSEALGVPRQFEGLAHVTGLAFRFEMRSYSHLGLEPPHPFGLLFGAELLRQNCKSLHLVVPFRQFL